MILQNRGSFAIAFSFTRILARQRKRPNRRFLRAYQKGARLTRENRVKPSDHTQMGENGSGHCAFRLPPLSDSLPIDGKISEKGIAIVVDQEFEQPRIKRKITVDEMVDRSFMKLLPAK